MEHRIRPLAIVFVCLTITGARAQTVQRASVDPIADVVAMVSESTYTRYVKGLESFGTRHALQPNRDSVASWLSHQFRTAGLTDVKADSFMFDTTRQWNLIAAIAGSEASLGAIVVGGHYDSQSSNPLLAPGADDNATGTAAVIEMARALVLAGYSPRHTLMFVAFGAEEMGLIGSEWFAAQAELQGRNVALMLNFDMIGTRRADQSDRDVNIVWYDGAIDEARLDSALFRAHTTLTPMLTSQYRTQSDSWPFARRGIKTVFHIERDFSTVYHTPNDSSTRLDLAYATDVVRGGLAMLLASDALSATAVAEAAVPSGWGLEQNFPNPFNAETRIGFRMEERGFVKVSVFDLLGRNAGVLASGEIQAGRHEVTWNASLLPSGVYVARFEAASASGRQIVDMKRLVLLK